MSAVSKTLLIFCKAPIPGQVKTRLIQDLGVEAATALHCELALRTIETCLSVPDVTCQLWCSPDTGHEFYRQFEMIKMLQRGTGLGERMHHAMPVEASQSTVLVGTDCPNLSLDYINQAFEKLEDHEVVIGPAEDGGYGLVGLQRANRKLFENIPWSTETVFADSCRVLNQQKINYSVLPRIWDVDRIADVHRYRRDYS